MIQIKLHGDANGKANRDLNLDGVAAALQHNACLLWLDVADPSQADLDYLTRTFHFHPLAMASLTKLHERPRLDRFDDYVVLIFYGLDPGQQLTPHRLTLFVGKNYIVSVHHGKLPHLDETAERWQTHNELSENQRISMLLYSVLDAIVDSYFPAIDTQADRMAEIEERIFERYDRDMQRELFSIRRELLVVRRVIGPERDILNALIRRESPLFGESSLVYFQDIYDRVLRVIDMLDLYHDMLETSLDAMLSVMSNRLNQIMRTLTAWSIIFMSVTLIASIYGMNFANMPELQWHYGYAYALALMAVLSGVMFVIFRRSKWL